MSSKSAFSARSSQVTGRFLQSAVIVDDDPHFGERPQRVIPPGRGPRVQAKEETEPTKGEPAAGRHDLDAEQLINAFAELGIVCAVLKPDLGSAGEAADEKSDAIESLSARTNAATKRADIVILDWNMPPEDKRGEKAKLLIKRILKTDEPPAATARADDYSRRLRLIAIYTGDEDLESITGEMAELLKALNLGDLVHKTYRVTAGSVTIAVYGKDKPTIAEPGPDAERRVSEDKLPKCLRDEFSEMTAGLLSNAALEALSAVRTNTHRILSRFNPGIDAPYVAHRAMMEPPEEAEEHPVPLIAAEIEGVLADDSGISKLVGLEALGEWLDHIELRDEVLKNELQMDSDAFKRALLSLLQLGLKEAEQGSEFPKWKKLVKKLRENDRSAASTLTALLAPAEIDGASPDMRFALLTSLRSRYEEPPPVLKLGSIVAVDDNGEPCYWLCVQPVCDSVRLTSSRVFPFLKLIVKTSTDSGPFDFVVFDQTRGEYKRLRCSRKAFDMVLFKMEPEEVSKSVAARREGLLWLFTRSGEEAPLRWIADLKTDHAHRIIDLFANEIKRVGLTESEWLRRMAISSRADL